MAATLLIPRARPRWLWGKASVRMALELANRKAPPTPWNTRMMISHSAPAVPLIQVSDSSIEKTVKMAKPRLYILTRPNMSPMRPKLTTSTAVTSRKPISIHRKYDVLPGASGLRWMPRKMSGREIRVMEPLMVTISTPIVVLIRAIHL